MMVYRDGDQEYASLLSVTGKFAGFSRVTEGRNYWFRWTNIVPTSRKSDGVVEKAIARRCPKERASRQIVENVSCFWRVKNRGSPAAFGFNGRCRVKLCSCRCEGGSTTQRTKERPNGYPNSNSPSPEKQQRRCSGSAGAKVRGRCGMSSTS
jgi:hypothetical protein